ncbi:hypothetical protein O7602_16015 [Micromonospora sp. WMMD1128]|uniref:hypothetical protein n=1 Tax=Micromonospora sp. WMMD1128 TaxID=3015150 RepID=UPI00248BDB86|nr:hypothetical protein [Micromonospora sp. WMMD1128]WBB71267.1 hypothetical protein O7602_16015 [Micromonospora sp. WMMD1128]
MPEPDHAAIAATLPGLDIELPTEPADLPGLPERWRPVASTGDPATRLALATALWNEPLLDVLPEFSAELRTSFFDVRACRVDGESALVYLARDDAGELLTWLGADPAGFVEPPFWEHFPEPLRTFHRQVHAGFTSVELDTFGPMHPRHMRTIAERAGRPDSFPDWDESRPIASTRLLLISSNGGQLDCCVSPDLPADHLALVHEGDIDPTPYGRAMDEMLMLRFEV